MPQITDLWTRCPYYDICKPYDKTTKCNGCVMVPTYENGITLFRKNLVDLDYDIKINEKENEKMITAVVPNPNDIREKRLDDSALYEEPPINVKIHGELCDYLKVLYVRKNHDYGDSFHDTYLEEGMAMPRIRLADKFSRFKILSRGDDVLVRDESLRDTLLDLANYAIMTVVEMDREKQAYDDLVSVVPENF